MALFIIYSDMLENEEEWAVTLRTLSHDSHSVCIVTTNKEKLQQRLSYVPSDDKDEKRSPLSARYKAEFANVQCVDSDEILDLAKDLETIKKLTDYKGADNNIIFTAPKSFDSAPYDHIIIDENNNHFKQLNIARFKLRRSNHKDFWPIHEALFGVQMDLMSNKSHYSITQLVPDENLKAQEEFLLGTLKLADSAPHLSLWQCFSVMMNSFKSPNHKHCLDNVTHMCRFGFIWASTTTGDLIERYRKQEAEKPQSKSYTIVR